MNYPQGPRAEQERPIAGQSVSGRSARTPDTRVDPRTGMRPTSASVHTLHAFGRNGDQVERRRPSIIGRMFRGFIRFVVTILIGIGATLAWQSYGDLAREMVAARAPVLASWLPPARLAQSSFALPNLAQQPAATPGLDALRRNVEQLAARQEQMVQSLAALVAIEADMRQKMAFTPSAAAPIPALGQGAPPVQQYKPAQPRMR